jgi:hypothetical protein
MPDIDKKQLRACYLAARAFVREMARSSHKRLTGGIDQPGARGAAIPRIIRNRKEERLRYRRLAPVTAGQYMRETHSAFTDSWEMSALTASFVDERLPGTLMQFLTVHKPGNHTVLIVGALPPCLSLNDLRNHPRGDAYIVDAYCGILCGLCDYPDVLAMTMARWRDQGRRRIETLWVGAIGARDPTDWVSDVLLSRISCRSPYQEYEEQPAPSVL